MRRSFNDEASSPLSKIQLKAKVMLKKSVLSAIALCAAGALGGVLAVSLSAPVTMHSQECLHASKAAVPAALVIEPSPQREIVPYAGETGAGEFIGTGDNSSGVWTRN